jgi:tripartite-type tricarboxylate transporter receptor subunit TctC
MNWNTLIAGFAVACSLAANAQPAEPSRWPQKPVRMLVGFTPGSSPDMAARMLAEPLSRALGQPIIVENKVGASGNIAAEQVAKSNDGHTIGLVINSTLTTAKALTPALPFDPAHDFSYLSAIASFPFLLVASNDVPHGKAFVTGAGKSGDKWSYGSVGNGSLGHLGMELLKSRLPGMAAVHVPFQGNTQVMTSLIGGQIQLAIVPPGIALPYLKSGRIKLLGVLAKSRSALMPDLPTLAENCQIDLELSSWIALVGPARLPVADQQRLEGVLTESLRSAELRSRFAAQGYQVDGGGSDAMKKRAASERSSMEAFLRATNIRAE